MVQTWHDLLFAHWPVPLAMLRPGIPRSLSVDTFDGFAWVGIVPFRMSDIQLRLLPASLPLFSAFPELNIRTYVTAPGGEKPGVFFYSLEASNPVMVAIANAWYRLPYRFADMHCRRSGDGIEYRSRRRHPGAPPAVLRGQYRPVGPVFHSAQGSLEAWLTDRYCLYTVDRLGRACRGEIDHPPWPLQSAKADLRFTGLTTQHGIKLPDTAPLLHFSRTLVAQIWTIEPIER
jgi:uncharacterized protein YqjF (DUF2071 family)